MWLQRGAVQCLLLSLRTKPEPELESFPYTQDQLGSINGFGVDQLMAIVFRCFDSVCTDNPTHTSACPPLWCNADVYTHALVCILLREKGLAINLVSSNNIKSANLELHEEHNTVQPVFIVIEPNGV